jgi:predicted enzyme related to lactoylglutathione lyase
MKIQNPMFILYVRDMNRAVAFYRDLFEMQSTMTTPGWSMLRFGGCTLALHGIHAGSSAPISRAAGLNFEVENLEAVADEVKAAGGKFGEIREAGGGAPVRVVEIQDPDGNVLELRQFMGAGANLAGR